MSSLRELRFGYALQVPFFEHAVLHIHASLGLHRCWKGNLHRGRSSPRGGSMVVPLGNQQCAVDHSDHCAVLALPAASAESRILGRRKSPECQVKGKPHCSGAISPETLGGVPSIVPEL